MGQDDWVHVNCALWSAEVYEEEHDGTLQNVQTALSRGRVMVSVEQEILLLYLTSFTSWKSTPLAVFMLIRHKVFF